MWRHKILYAIQIMMNDVTLEGVIETDEAYLPIKGRYFFTGFVPYAEIPSYLRMSNVAVVPSIWDAPFPTTILEAQAAGLPIITTRRGVIPEEVSEDNAILIDTDENIVASLSMQFLNSISIQKNGSRWKQLLSNVQSISTRRYTQKTFLRC